jgi:hypothetical protein
MVRTRSATAPFPALSLVTAITKPDDNEVATGKLTAATLEDDTGRVVRARHQG